MLWDAASQLQSHESVRHAVFEIVLAIEKDLSKRLLDVLFEKIKTFPIMKWDQKFVQVVLQLQMHCEKERATEVVEEEDEMKTSDDVTVVSSNIPPGVRMFCDAVLRSEHDDSIMKVCLSALIEMLKWKTMRRVHKDVFVICADSIRAHRCVRGVFDCSPYFNENILFANTNTQVPVCLKILSETIQQHYGIFEDTLASIVQSLNLKGLVYEDLQHVTSSTSTSCSTDAHLKFLELLLDHSKTTLSQDDLNLLWTCCVVNCISQQKMFFVWFERMHRKRHVSPELVETFLCTKMPSHHALCSIPFEGFECFAYLFNFINEEKEKNITVKTDDESTSTRKYIGFELLWRIVIEAEDEKNVVKPAIELLMRISEEKTCIHDCMRRLKEASST